jgi:transcriptional regulator with XRE-family HTH domain
MQRRGLSQAELARAVGVADAQISRWRRGQVVPTVHHLQRIANVLQVGRIDLDRLAGYPTDDAASPAPAGADSPELQAELQAYQAQFTRLLQEKLPRHLWHAYAEACAALADQLGASFAGALRTAQTEAQPSQPAAQPPEDSPPESPAPSEPESSPTRHIGFRP